MINRRVFLTLLAGAAPRGQAAPPLDRDTLGLFRVVEDGDGFVNVRGDPSTKAKVLDRIKSGCAVAVGTSRSAWLEIEDETGAGRTLYIHESRLKPITGWKQVPCAVAGDGQSASVQSGGLKVVVKEVPFDPGAHSIKRPKEGSDGRLTIDGHRVVGTDGGLPRSALRLEVMANGKPVTVPPEATRDLYQPNLGRTEDLILLTPGDATEHALVFLWGSDGAGGYAVIWSFVKGAYAGRAVFTGF